MTAVTFGLHGYVSLSGFFAALVLMTGQGHPAAEPTPQSPLKIAGNTTLLLDPACSTCKVATLPLVVQNTGKEPVRLELRAEPLRKDPEGTFANVKTSLAPGGEQSFSGELKPGEAVPIAVTVQGFLGTGNWKTEIYNGAVLVGPARFILPELALRLKLDTADPNQPAITLTRGEKNTLTLKNDDTVPYMIDSEFTLASRPGAVKNHNTIAAGGSAILPIEPKDEWFEQAGAKPSFRGIFKDDQVDGFLLLYHTSEDANQTGRPPAKLFRVKTTLAYYDAVTKALLSYTTLIFLLVLGALASLYINYKFPDEQIRNDLRQQLAAIGDGIESLSMRLASRLRVLVGVERRALGERLNRLRWYSTDFESQRAEIASSTARLRRRVDLLEQMGRLRNDYEQLLTLDVPPTIMDRLENLFEQTGKLLELIQISETDLQEATLKLVEIRKTLSGWSQPDPTLAAQISASLSALGGDLQPSTGVLVNSPTFKSIRGEFTSLLTQLSAFPQTQFPASDYYRWDSLAFRLLSLRTYALLCDTRDPPAGTPLVTKRAELFKSLKTESWDRLKCARRLVWEMSEEIYTEDVQSQFENKQIEIHLDRNQVRMFEPAQFYLRFVDKKFDSATAKDEWSCTWNFGHGPFRGKNDDPKNFFEETGWSVAHYFPVADTYTVKIRFQHEQRGELQAPDTLPVTVHKDVFVGNTVDTPDLTGRAVWLRSRSNKLGKWTGENGHAIARLILALVPAILALVAGAKDQILKMDLFPALCAVFLAGFGSDQVKNLLSQKPKQ